MTDTPEDSQTKQAPGAALPGTPVDTPQPPTPPATSTGRDHPLPPNGNLLTRIIVPAYLVVLILVFTDVLLITWPITHADESVACRSASDRGHQRSPFSVIDDVVHDLVQYCPDKIKQEGVDNGKPVDPPPTGKQQDDEIPQGTGTAGQDMNAAGGPSTPIEDPTNPGNPDQTNETTETEPKPPKISKNTVPRQGNALFLAVLSAGMIGGAVYSLRAHTVHIAIGKYQASWWQWNVTRPFLSGALAILFFFLVRAGFVEGGQAGSLRPEGFIAIGGLVGLFTDQAWAKIRQVANAMFAEADHGAETGHTPPVTTPPQTEAGTPPVTGAGGGAAPVPPGS